MIESIRFTHAVQFGGEVVQSIVRGKSNARIVQTETGYRVFYTMTNASLGLKTERVLFVPYSNILQATESIDVVDGNKEEASGVNKDTARKVVGR